MNNPPPPRTKPEAIRDLDYMIRLNQRHERLYGRALAYFRLAEILAGALGLAVALGATAIPLTVAGGLFAMIGLAAYAFEPSKRLAQYAIALREYTAIRTRVATLDIDCIDSQCTAVEDPSYIEGLRLPSFNDVMLSHGLDSAARPLTRWQRIMHAIA